MELYIASHLIALLQKAKLKYMEKCKITSTLNYKYYPGKPYDTVLSGYSINYILCILGIGVW